MTFVNGMRIAIMAGLLSLAQLGGVKADEVDNLRAEVQQLKQKVLYLENQLPKGTAAVGGTPAAQNEVRFQQYDQQMSQLTGQIEQLELKINDLADKFERMQKDTEFRLGAVESGGAGAAGAAGAAVAGATATARATDNVAANTTDTDPGAPPQPGQPGVMGTLSADQMQSLPQAPAGAAEQAAASSIVLPGDTPQQQYDYATGLVQRGAYPEAEIALKAFVAEHPKDPLAGNAQYWLGETYYVRSDFKNASVAFAEGYQKYPKSAKSSDNLLKLGMSLGQIGRNSDACTAFRQLDKQFPGASQAIKDRAARAKQRYKCG